MSTKVSPQASEVTSNMPDTTQGTAPKQASFAPSIRATRKGQSAPTKRPRGPWRHQVYAIKLSDEGMKAFDEEHFQTTPKGSTEEEVKEWWASRRSILGLIIPSECIAIFDLPSVNGRIYTMVHDGDGLEHVVVLADNATRRTNTKPSDDLVAKVAKFIHQEGDTPRWYRVARLGDEPSWE